MKMNSTDITKAIDRLAKTGAAFQKMAQETAVNVAEHFAEHKDTGLVNRLYLAMPKGSNKEGMARWLLNFLAVEANTDAKTKGDQPFLYAKGKTTDLAAARETMWYDMKAHKDPDQVFDFQAIMRSVIRRAAKASKTQHFDGPAREALRLAAIAAGIPASDVPDLGLTKATTPSSKEAQRPSKPTITKGDAARVLVEEIPAILTEQAA